jgi:hypothetical protein
MKAAIGAARPKEDSMRYLLTLYRDESLLAGASPEESQRTMDEYTALSREWLDKGLMLSGEGLDPSSTATTVRVRDGEKLITDGPFAESKEQLGGYYVVDCDAIDEAIELAARVPLARFGAVEVRPVMNYEAMGAETPVWRSEARAKKYVVTLWGDESAWADWSPEQMQQEMERWAEYDRKASAAGVLLGGEGLEPSDTAKTVRVRDGERLVSDGPFAETKEQLGGFYLLDCKDLDEAIEWAAKVPVPDDEPVEIRPVMDYGGTSYKEIERMAEARP